MTDPIEDVVIPHLRTVTEPPELVEAIKAKGANYEELKIRIVELKDLTQGKREPDLQSYNYLSDDQREEIRRLASDIDELKYQLREKLLLDDILIAQCLFARNLTREKIIKELKEWPSDRLTDILTCWGWIKRHAELIAMGTSNLYKPFECEIGPASARSRTRHNVDREFWVLRSFITSFNQQIKSDFNFFEKREQPDFLLMNSNNEALGAEITDAHVDENWARNHGIRTDILRDLHNMYKLPHIIMSAPCDIGQYWKDDPPEIHQKIHRVFANEIAPYYHGDVKNNNEWELYGIYIGVRPGHSIDLRTDREDRPYAGDYFERVNAEALIYKIKEKLQSNPPEIRPCILIVQPVVDLPIGAHNLVIQKVQNELASACSNQYYDEIWYLYNDKGYRLSP